MREVAQLPISAPMSWSLTVIHKTPDAHPPPELTYSNSPFILPTGGGGDGGEAGPPGREAGAKWDSHPGGGREARAKAGCRAALGSGGEPGLGSAARRAPRLCKAGEVPDAAALPYHRAHRRKEAGQETRHFETGVEHNLERRPPSPWSRLQEAWPQQKPRLGLRARRGCPGGAERGRGRSRGAGPEAGRSPPAGAPALRT